MHYTITAELTGKVGAADTDPILDALTGYHPALAVSDHGHPEVIISLPADTLGQAVSTALAVIEHATGRSVLTVAALTSSEHDRRIGVEHLPDLVGVTEAAAILGVSRQRVLQLIDAGSLAHARAGNAVVIPRTAVIKRASASQGPAPR